MMIKEPSRNPHATRELKVNLPIELHIRLHESKIMDGERICDVVARALDDFFAEAAAAPRAAEDTR